VMAESMYRHDINAVGYHSADLRIK